MNFLKKYSSSMAYVVIFSAMFFLILGPFGILAGIGLGLAIGIGMERK